jgi:hypothetical protein
VTGSIVLKKAEPSHEKGSSHCVRVAVATIFEELPWLGVFTFSSKKK